MTQEAFIVKGRTSAWPEVEIRWSESDGFDDPTGMTTALIHLRKQVCKNPNRRLLHRNLERP